jgi:hypothetical protein
VLGLFNAAIAHPLGAAEEDVPKPDELVTFVVRDVHQSNGLLSMHGDLAATSSGCGKSHADTALQTSPAGATNGTHPTAESGEEQSGSKKKRKRTREEKEERRRKKHDKAHTQ